MTDGKLGSSGQFLSSGQNFLWFNLLKMKEIYIDYARYNLWANRRICELFSTLTEEQANRHVESSFPSVKKTVLHIWDAEVIWLSRLKGKPVLDFPSKGFDGNFSEACKGMLETSAEFLAKVEATPEADFEAEMSFSTIASGDYSHRIFEMIHHCMNHSTYHRGQLITFARQLGMKNLPSTDMIFYLRQKRAEV